MWVYAHCLKMDIIPHQEQQEKKLLRDLQQLKWYSVSLNDLEVT